MATIFADANRSRMRFIRTTDGWGTTPATGKTRELRYTGSTITMSKQTTISDEIRADRMVSDVIEVSAKTAGDVNIEFSAGSHDDFLESFMMGAWTRPMSFDSITGGIISWFDDATIYVSGVDLSNYFVVGHRIRTVGFVTAANNNYWQISSITWNSGNNRTEIGVTETTAVAEAGNAVCALYDANDVIVMKSTVIRSGTAGAATFDSNGGNAFASAIAAGQLLVGQKIHVDGLGYGAGSFAFSANPAAGSTVTVSDGVNPVVTFQLGGTLSGGSTNVLVAIGAADTDTATNLAAAINQYRVNGQEGAHAALNVAATVSSATVNVKNLFATGGVLAKVLDTGAAITATTFAGGNASEHGIYTITGLSDDVLTVSPAPSTNANAGALPVTVKGSMLRNPADAAHIVPQDYVIETGFEDVNQFFVADGQRVGTFEYDFTANQILKGKFSFSGRAMNRFTASKLGDAGSYTVLGTTATSVANATVNVGQIEMNGVALSTALQSITLTGDNSLRDQNAVSYKFPAGIGAGRMMIKGAVKAYFADGTLWDHFNAHDTVSVNFSVQDVEGHHYEWTVPAAKFSTDTVNPAGGNQDIMEDMEYEAKRDPATNCQIQIDRFSCVLPTTA